MTVSLGLSLLRCSCSLKFQAKLEGSYSDQVLQVETRGNRITLKSGEALASHHCPHGAPRHIPAPGPSAALSEFHTTLLPTGAGARDFVFLPYLPCLQAGATSACPGSRSQGPAVRLCCRSALLQAHIPEHGNNSLPLQ